VAEGIGPEFKPQYCQKKKKEKRKKDCTMVFLKGILKKGIVDVMGIT
jgi:hypothetical protein